METITYTYDCGNDNSATFKLIVKIHPCVFDQKTISKEALNPPADCTHDAVYYKSCECGEKCSICKKVTKTPGLTVKDSAGKTVSSKYYTVVKSSGRKNVGKYTYKITFKGNYKGSKT